MTYDDEETHTGEEYEFVTTKKGKVNYVLDKRHPQNNQEDIGILVIPHKVAVEKKEGEGEGEGEEGEGEEGEGGEDENASKKEPEEAEQEEEEEGEEEEGEGEEGAEKKPKKKKYLVCSCVSHLCSRGVYAFLHSNAQERWLSGHVHTVTWLIFCQACAFPFTTSIHLPFAIS